jgi:hypothetical protein
MTETTVVLIVTGLWIGGWDTMRFTMPTMAECERHAEEWEVYRGARVRCVVEQRKLTTFRVSPDGSATN